MRIPSGRCGQACVGSKSAAVVLREAETFRAGPWRAGGAAGAALAMALAGAAVAGPEDARVVRGNVNIQREGSTTTIRASRNSIINFRSFNVGSGETVRFVQPDAASRVLNRITGAAPSRIDGSLLANGRVYIVNPAGVVFGNGAVVNVSGLFAAAGHMSDADFVRGVDRVTGAMGRVENHGLISVGQGGAAALVGNGVLNAGSSVAPGGAVVMAAGTDVVVGTRDGTTYARVSGAAGGDSSRGAVENSGKVDASRGRALIAAGDVAGLAIRMTGEVRAKDIKVEGQGRGAVVVEGTLDARDQNVREVRAYRTLRTVASRGGDVAVTGEHVGLLGAEVDASGRDGAGSILIGGDVRGAGEMRRAQVTAVNDATVLRADALRAGDGGTVVVYADDTAKFFGAASARGAGGGDGGFVETSGKQHLSVDGSRIDAAAGAGGMAGEWLIDPRNVALDVGPTAGGAFGPSDPDLFTPSADDSVVAVGDIETRLNAGTNVTITTGADGTQEGNIEVLEDITRTGTSGAPTFRLEAANNVRFAAGVNVRVTGGGPLDVVVIANAGGANDPDPATGAVIMETGSSIETGGGNITIGGGTVTSTDPGNPLSPAYAAALRASAARGTAIDMAGVSLDEAVLDAGTGTVIVRGAGVDGQTGAPGVSLTGATLVQGAVVRIDGIGGDTTGGDGVGDGNHGVVMGGGARIKATGTGASVVRGAGGASDQADGSAGVAVSGVIEQTGNGVLNVIGVGANGSGANNPGVRILTGGAVRATGTGDVGLTGQWRASGFNNYDIFLDGGTFGDAAATGRLFVTGDSLRLQSGLVQGLGTAIVRPRTTGANVGVGSGAAGLLQLEDADIAVFNTFQNLEIGRSSAGAIRTTVLDRGAVDQDLTLVGSGLDTAGIVLNPGVNNLTLDISGTATQSGAIVTAGLTILNSGDYTFTDAGNQVLTLAGNASGSVTLNDPTGIFVGQLGAVSGLTGTASWNLSGDRVVLDRDLSGSDFRFNAPVTLEAPITINGTTAVRFFGTLDASPTEQSTLAINSPITIFTGNVGMLFQGELGSLVTDAGGTVTVGAANVRTIGSQSYGDEVTVTTNTNFLAGAAGGVNFLGGLQADGGPRNVTITSGTGTLFDDPVGTTSPLATLTVNGPAFVSAPVTTSGALAFNGDLQVVEDSAISGLQIAFDGRVDSGSSGARNLTINGGNGVVSFTAPVGGLAPLASLDVTGGSTSLLGVTTTGSQRYNAATTLSGVMRSTTSGTILFTGDLDILTDSEVRSAGTTVDHDVTISGRTNSRGGTNRNLIVSAGLADVIFGNDIGLGSSGDQSPIDTLTVSGGTLTLRAVRTSSSQVYTGATTLRGNLTTTGTGAVAIGGATTLGADISIGTSAGDIVFGGVVNSDATARALTLGTGGSAQTRFTGAVGSTNRLAALTTNADGTTRIEGGTVRTVNDQVYNDAVLLGANTTLEGNDVQFATTLNSDGLSTFRNLTINTAANGSDSGETTFGAAVGGTARLGLLTTNAEGATRVLGDIFTRRGMTFGDQVQLQANATFDGGIGGLFFRASIEAESTATDPTLVLLSDGPSDIDDAPFKFAASIGSGRRLGALTIGADRAGPASAATIIFADSFDPQGRVVAANALPTDTFTIVTGGGGFAMGAGQKLTAFGSATVTSTGAVTVGDMNALRNITVNGSAINVRTRGPGSIFDNVIQNPDELVPDSGVDFQAGNAIDFNRTPVLVGSGNAPTFSTGSGTVDAELAGFLYRDPTTPIDASRFTDPNNTTLLLPLDLRAEGGSRTDIASSVLQPESLAPQRRAPDQAPLSAGERELLARFGIETRDLTQEERVDAARSGRLEVVAVGATFGASDGTGGGAITTSRVDVKAAQDLLAGYEEFTGEGGGDPDRPVIVREVLGAAWLRYTAQVRVATGEGWRAYLESMGSTGLAEDAEALLYLNQAREIMRKFNDIGLAPGETRAPRLRLLNVIKPAQVESLEQFERAVMGPELVSWKP